MKPPLTRLAAGILACLIALLGACLPNLVPGNRFMNKSARATAFFKDHYLLIAQAIERHDRAQLKQLGPGQDLSLKGEQDMDLLWFAIARENFDAIRILVELAVNPDKQLADGIGSALDFA